MEEQPSEVQVNMQKTHAMITRSDKSGATKKRKLWHDDDDNDKDNADGETNVTVNIEATDSDDEDEDEDAMESDDEASSDEEEETDDEEESDDEEDDMSRFIVPDDDDEGYDESDEDYDPREDEESGYYEDDDEMDAEVEEEYDENEDEVTADPCEHHAHEEEGGDSFNAEGENEEDDSRRQTRAAAANFARFSQMLFSKPPVIIINQQRPRANSDSPRSNLLVQNPKLRFYSAEEKKYYQALDPAQKELVDKTEVSICNSTRASMPMRFKIIQSDIDAKIKTIAITKLEHLDLMSPSSGEYHKLTNWMEALVNIPFGKYRGVPIIRELGQSFNPAEVSKFLSNTKGVLDQAVYGHTETKNQMIRFLAQWIVNPKSNGSVIGIHGRPGVGKTTLVKDGICKALDIPFAFIPLGGASDGSYLEGHSYTYEGSTWGKIVDVVMKAGCMNPILYFDELDKVSTTSRGEEIINMLIHLTDPGQNTHFADKYFMDVPIDLSKCIVIFTYNDDSIVNPILKDRMIRIEVNDYTVEDKTRIAQAHLMPSLVRQFSFSPQDIVVSEEVIRMMVNSIDSEAGVRNLRRALELLYSTANLKRLLQGPVVDTAAATKPKPDALLDDAAVIQFPLTITEDMLDVLLKRHKLKKDASHTHMFSMYT